MSGGGLLTADRPTRIAVVVPAKDEAGRIEATVRAASGIDAVDVVVVVDDGSTDATAAVAKGAGALVVRHRTNQGKAAAMATGARVIAMREDTAHADGGEDFREELHAEPRVDGHTGPLPAISGDTPVPRALLFLDADMQDSAAQAQPLVRAVLEDGVDMAIALLPPQDGAAGRGIVVRTARRGIERATGWEPQQPLSGTRCITREAWDACQPPAPGWGVETALTIDALSSGFWVKEIPCDLRHRATGKDLGGQLHRAAQLRDVVRALLRRRTVHPPELDLPETEPEHAAARDTSARAVPATPPRGAEGATPTSPTTPPGPPAPGTADASFADRLAALPVAGAFSDEQVRALGEADIDALAQGLGELPVAGPFEPGDVVFLADVDLGALAQRMRRAPVEGPFEPEHAVILGAHLRHGAPRIPAAVDLPLEPAEYVSLAVHAAVDAADADAKGNDATEPELDADAGTAGPDAGRDPEGDVDAADPDADQR